MRSQAKSPLKIALLGLLILLSIYSIPTGLVSIPSVHASTRTIWLTAYIATGWNASQPSGPNPTVIVTTGDSITLKLNSGDGQNHQFYVDYDGNGVPDCSGRDYCSPVFSSLITTTLVMVSPGTYTYYDPASELGHGTFKIRPSYQDYEIAANPSALSIPQSSNANSTIIVTSINNYAGAITLSLAGTPPGFTPIFGTNPVTITANGTAASKLTFSVSTLASFGAHSINVYASNATSSHYIGVVVTVLTTSATDFSITISPASLTFTRGSSGSSTITVASQYGFSGTVGLTATVSPTGPVASISPASLTIAAGGSANANLTVSSSSAIPASYTVTVSGTSGTLSHSANEPLTLSPTSTGPSIGNVPLTLLTGAFIAAVVLIGSLVYFMRRKTGKP